MKMISLIIALIGGMQIPTMTFASEGDAFQAKIKAADIQVLEKGAAEKARKLLWDSIQAYWSAYDMADFESLYRMYTDEFRETMTLNSFLKKKRFLVTAYSIKSVSFWGDQCAYVRYYLDANNEGMVLKNLLLKHYWVYRDGVWSVHENPKRANPMFGQMDDPNPPCALPKDSAKNTKKK